MLEAVLSAGFTHAKKLVTHALALISQPFLLESLN